MAKYFSYSWDEPFVLFGADHLATILLTAVLLGFLYFYFRDASERRKRRGAHFLAILLILQELSILAWKSRGFQTFDPTDMLPLHLCGFSIVLSAIMLWTRSYLLFEVLYFLGIAGALQAFLTPTLQFGFPHFRFVQMFLGHGLIIAAVVFMAATEGYRPHARSMVKSFAALLIVSPFIGAINYLLQFVPPYRVGNYFYLCYKPPTASILNLLPDWPYYLIPVAGIAWIFFLLLYMPYLIFDVTRRSEGRQPEPESEA